MTQKRFNKSCELDSTRTTSYAYDAANRLTSTAQNGGAASAVTSDADGNTLTDSSGRTNVWDSQNRLVSCTKAGVTSSYTYGADGLRRSATVNGITTYYVYDGTMMVREMQKTGGTGALFNTATYLTGPRGPEYRRDDTQTETDGQGHTFGKTRWYVYDGLGSVVGEVDPLGNLTSSPKYDVYGAVRANAGTASSRQGFVGGLGHVSDTETGLVYMRARYCDPSVGRFESEDSSKNGMNWFAYCSNNPTNRTDKTGKVDDLNDLYNSLEDWGITHPLAAGLLGGVLGAYVLNFLSILPAAAAGAQEMIGMALMMAGDALITGGNSLVQQSGVSLSVYGISSTASEVGEAAALGSALKGAAQGIGGAAELSAGITLQSIGEFLMYS